MDRNTADRITEKLNEEQTERQRSTDKGKTEKELRKTVESAVVGSASETVVRYGEANREYIVAYSGVDNVAGNLRHQSLKSISKSKVNSAYAKQNIKQQSGYSAEVLSVADSNAENIVRGKSARRGRTDDHGSVNDQHYDTMEYDVHGNPVAGSGVQIKFVGSTPQETLSKLASKRYEKYLEADAKLEIPSDKYDGVVRAVDEKINSIKQQLKDPRVAQNQENSAAKKRELAKYSKIRKNLHKSSVSSKEAEFARLHPKLATAERIAKYSHQAGIKGAKFGVTIGGTVSVVQNVVRLLNEQIESEEAARNIAKDTTEAAVVGYVTTSAGSALNGVLRNAENKTISALGKRAAAGPMIQLALTSGKVIKKWASGEIDGAECFKELGEDGTSMISASMFAVAGQMVLPIVGALAGSMLGYALSASFYDCLNSALQEAKLAREERERIERECAAQIRMMCEYKAEMERIVSRYLSDMRENFDCALSDMRSALASNDANKYIRGANKIGKTLGKSQLFQNFSEFDDLMRSPATIKL